MNKDLEEVKKIIKLILGQIESNKETRKSILVEEPVYAWQKKDANILNYVGLSNYHYQEFSCKPFILSKYYREKALPVYLQWQDELKKECRELFHKKCKQIPKPDQNISLYGYIKKLESSVRKKCEKRDVWMESLNSFCYFLREDAPLEDKGLLEDIFPSKQSCKGMVIKKGYKYKRKGKEEVETLEIFRIVENTAYPIDIFTSAEIVLNLINAVISGRKNLQRSAAQALGFAWVCLHIGLFDINIQEKDLYSIKITDLRVKEIDKGLNPFLPTHFININTIFGVCNIPVSPHLYDYLLGLPRPPETNKVFNMHWSTVLRTFRNKGVKLSLKAQALGKITFFTFMQKHHELIGYRYSPSKIKKRNEERIRTLEFSSNLDK